MTQQRGANGKHVLANASTHSDTQCSGFERSLSVPLRAKAQMGEEGRMRAAAALPYVGKARGKRLGARHGSFFAQQERTRNE